MVYYPSCENIVRNDCNVCETENARVRRCALIHKNYYPTLIADAENPNTWLEGIQNGNVYIYPETNGEFDGGVGRFGRGFATAQETLLAYNYSVSITDPDYQGNVMHWGRLAGNKNYYLAFCSESVMTITTRVCNIVPINPIDNDLKSEVTWQIQFRWTDFELPLQYSIPDGVFQCGGWQPPVFSGIGWMTIGTTFIVG